MPGVESRIVSLACVDGTERRLRCQRASRSDADPREASAVRTGRQPCPRNDLLDDRGLRVRIVLDVLPFPGSQLALRPPIEFAILVVRPEPVAEADHPPELRRVRRE